MTLQGNPTSSRSARAGERRQTLVGLAFVSPWLLGFATLTAYPIAAALYYSFCDYRVLTPPRWVGLRNYVELFTDRDYFLPTLANTAFMFLEIPIGTALAVGLALLLNQRIRGLALFRTAIYLPSVVPTVASAVLWLWLLNPEYGLINKGLAAVRLPTSEWLQSPQWSKPAFIVMDLWTIGGTMIIYLAALQGVPEQLYEAAYLDGASSWRRVWHITLPAISPVIFFNVVLALIATFQYFAPAFLMTGTPPGGPANSTNFYALALFQNAFAFGKMGYACAMAWVLFVLTLLATAAVFRSARRWVYYEDTAR